MNITKRLDPSPEYLKLLLNNSREGIIACDIDCNITFRNDVALSQHGIPLEAKVDEWSEYVTFMDPQGITPLSFEELPLIRALRGEEVHDVYCLLKRKSQGEILLKYNATPLLDSHGERIGVLLTSQDKGDLAQTVARFKAIFDQSPLSIQILNRHGRTLLVNRAFQALWSISDEFVKEFILKDYNMLEDPILIKSGHIELILRAFKGETIKIDPLYYDPAIVGLPGRPRWTEAILYPLKNIQGEVCEVVIIHQDVTDQQHVRSEKERLFAKLQAVLRQMPAGVMVANTRGEIPIYSQKMEELIGEPARAKEVFMVQLQKSILGQSVEAAEVRTKTMEGMEQIFTVNSSPIFDSEGKIRSSIVIATDVTNEKREQNNEALLAQLKCFLLTTLDYDQIIEKIASATIPSFADGCLFDLIDADSNNRIVVKHRYPHVENLMHTMRTYYPPTPGSNQPTIKVLETGLPDFVRLFDNETLKQRTLDARHSEFVRQIGSRSNIAVPIFARGKVIGAINFIVTTDRPLFDEVDLEVAKNIAHYTSFAIENGKLLKEAQCGVQLRDEFISIASHELKTPITSLNLQVQVLNSLTDELNHDSEVPRLMRKFLDSTNNQLKRLSRLVDDMLDISRINSGKLTLNIKHVNLKSLSLEVLERFEDFLKEQKIEVSFFCNHDVWVHCDAERIDQVMTNLMTNAIRYGNKKPIHFFVEESQEVACFKVKDHGRGVYKEDQERIFKRFERAHTAEDVSGLGLGLYINKQIVDEHKGKIILESEPGKGSLFTVELPKRLPEK